MRKQSVERGPEWLERAHRMPADGIPFHRSGNVAGIVTSTEGVLVNEVLNSNVNGLRISALVWAVSSASVQYSIRLYRNGNIYSQDFDLILGGSSVLFMLPVYAVYEAGELLELRILNTTGVNRDAAGCVIGWYF